MKNSDEKANRLIIIRKLTRLNRKEMAEMAGVSVSTYKDWEYGRFKGIPEKRAAVLANNLQINEGIEVSADWIINGTGETPKKIILTKITQPEKTSENIMEKQSPEKVEQLHIKAELEFFCNNKNWETISFTVPDNAMAPYFLPGDLVAGVKTPPEDFIKISGLNCIIRIKNNKTLIRQIQKSKTKNFFTLLSLNPSSKQRIIIIQDTEVVDIAPIIWVRKKLPNF